MWRMEALGWSPLAMWGICRIYREPGDHSPQENQSQPISATLPSVEIYMGLKGGLSPKSRGHLQ